MVQEAVVPEFSVAPMSATMADFSYTEVVPEFNVAALHAAVSEVSDDIQLPSFQEYFEHQSEQDPYYDDEGKQEDTDYN